MLQAIFYNFAKRENSTKQPTGEGKTIDISIKVPSSIEEPTLEINDADIKGFNYVYIPYYARYYFITDRESIALNTYVIQCRCDPLASFKAELAGQNVYAEYASYGYSAWLRDPRVNKTKAITVHRQAELIELFTIQDGGPKIFHYCRVIAENGALNGYDVIMGDTSLRPLINKLSRTTDLQTLMLDIGGADPYASICEIWDTPLQMDKCHKGSALGNAEVWGVQIGGRKLTNADIQYHDAVLNLHHNDMYNDFRDEWLIYNLFIPYVGVINLPTELCNVCDTVKIRYAGDCVNGQIAFSVNLEGDETIPIGTYGANLKSANALGRQQGENGRWAAGAMAVGGAAIGAGAFSGSLAAGVAAAGAAEISTFIGMAGPGKMQQVGSFTGGLACTALLYESERFILEVLRPGTVTDPSNFTAIAGRPVQKVIAIGNGYIKARGASVAISGTDTERRTINALLNGGIYYE